MKAMLRILLIGAMAVAAMNVIAQTSSKKNTADSIKAVADTLGKIAEVDFPSLMVLIDSAVRHNAMVSYRGQEFVARQANLKIQQNSWLRNMGIQADTRYGTFDNFSSNANGQSTTIQSVTSNQFNYGGGLFIKLPVFDVISRKTQIKQAKAEVEQAKYLQQEQENEIRQAVIKLYEDLLLKQKLLRIKSQNMGSATVNYEMVEREFRNGVIPTAEYVRLSDMTSRIKSEYEMAKSDFIVAKKILEEVVGFAFKNPDSD
ncbi:MAG: TolC family protein [Agriterribacter sp.]